MKSFWIAIVFGFGFLTNSFAASTNTLTQYGITWDFSAPVEYGQFVNGDYWVLDPGSGVVITGISNTFHSGLDLSTVDYDGSMIDCPRPNSIEQGLDNRPTLGSTYVAGLNINKSLPKTITGNKTVLSSISWLATDPGYITPNSVWYFQKRIALLTILTSVPPANSFRPSYAVGQKTIYSAASLRTNLLPSLAPPNGVTDIATQIANTNGSYYDMNDHAYSEFLRPSDNYNLSGGVSTYGRYISEKLSDAFLATTFDPNVVGSKTALINNLIQIGIDYYGLLLNGAKWSADGGHRMGYKLPILFAGLMLNNVNMLAIGTTYPVNTFQEDGQYFYISADDVAAGISCSTPAVPVEDRYSTSQIGTPEWGIVHTANRCYDTNLTWAINEYRQINGSASMGQALFVHIMGIQSQWNNNAFLDYMDRYVSKEFGSISAFSDTMWALYRDNYPPVWVESAPVCDSAHLTLCTSQSTCEAASGHFCGGTCGSALCATGGLWSGSGAFSSGTATLGATQ